MKRLLIFFSFLLISNLGLTQNYNVSLGGNFDPTPIFVGGNSTLTVEFVSTSVAQIPVGGVLIQVEWNIGFSGTTLPIGNGADLFDWVYIPPGDIFTYGGWFGTQDVLIGFGAYSMEFQVVGTSPNNILNPASGYATVVAGEGDSETDNNGFSAPLLVNAVLPIELTSFYGKVVDCESIDLAWSTASEQNNAYMEVLRSTDGKEFLSIGKVEGSNNARGSSYSLEDRNFLEPGTKYLYRIRQVDFDGSISIHKLILVQYDCHGVKATMKVYPNPAMDNLNVTISGGNIAQDVSFHLYDIDGALVRKLSIAPDGVNELSLLGLSPGIYHIKSVNLEEPLYARFIKID